MVEINVNGKVAVVTGGSRGLGLQCAEILIANGASKVFVSSRGAAACEEAAKSLNELAKAEGQKGVAYGIAADVSGEKGARHLLAEVSKLTDKVDILIANAGASWGAPFEKHPEAALHKVLNLNVIGVFLCIQAFAPLLEHSGSDEDPSRVLIMASVAGLNTNFPGGAYGYLSSKAAVIHLGKVLATELGPKNITVNSLAPGFFPSKMSGGLLKSIGESMVAANPRKRLGEKQDIQNLTLFLCSKQASYINGAVIPLDGGAHLAASKL
ncbi:unnamed protein product [Kuraishia capsulata CBS 1993]|uniref:Ketoreductase (KR) domain-containing protein n=1 Tax=Kuraishia capsulata CBS 1993 TaxID=1382522 RepID=W6MLF3_9ASCO|nr:uncharacterized protein KUCA_T00003312001 [Kuraishia capsulata CBS 1993]CDK27334.1 unnamed protein product [Kuraishia capsulata CBS 1993]